VEQEPLADGRPVQFGGELTAEWQTAYVELVAELGRTLEPSYTALELPYAWGAHEGIEVGEHAPWMDTADVEDLAASMASWPHSPAASTPTIPGATPRPPASTRSASAPGCIRWAPGRG
jgi:monoamine oxidase